MAELISLFKDRIWDQADPAFFNSLLLGDRSGLPEVMVAAFRAIGLYHLLVISGLHTTLYLGMIRFLLKSPIHLAYLCRLVVPEFWRRCSVLIDGGCVGVLGLILGIFPLAAPSSRACSCALSHMLLGRILGYCGLPLRLGAAVMIQLIVQGADFLALGNGLSWLAYAIVLRHIPSHTQGVKPKLIGVMTMQVSFMAMTVACFGEVSLLSPMCNAILVPLFPLILLGMIVAIGFDFQDPLSPMFTEIIADLAEISVNSGLYLTELHPIVRLLAALYLVGVLFKVWDLATIPR